VVSRAYLVTCGVLASLLGGGCVVERDVRLELARGPGGLPAGFLCRAPTAGGGGPRLLEQVASQFAPCDASCGAGSCRRAAFVFDFIETAGVPSCRGGALAAFCGEERCALTVRRCFEVDTCLDPEISSTIQSVDDGLHLATGGVVLPDAPTAPVLVRMIGTAQSCADVEAGGLARASVFGCAYSCPAQLDAVEGSVLLDLDVLDDECGASVHACALFLSGERPVP